MDDGTWWVEAQRQQGPITLSEEERDEETPSNFAFAEKYSKEPVALPGGVEFRGVLKENGGLFTEGVAYVHFFPNGFNEQAMVYLVREGSEETGFSLVIRPTAGRVEIHPGIVNDFNVAPEI